MLKTRVIPWQNADAILSGTVVTCILVMGLQWGRPVLVPVALAILLTLLLNPLVKMLQRHGFGRMLAVMIAVSVAGILILLIGVLVTRQITILAAELPQNTANIKAKVKALRQMGSSAFPGQFQRMAEEMGSDVDLTSTRQPPQKIALQTESGREVAVEPVLLATKPTPWLTLTGYLSSAFEVLATLAFSLILLVIFLIGRDNLRDRLVVLAGKARIALTSKALEDVTERIRRYLMMVAAINGGYGVVLALGHIDNQLLDQIESTANRLDESLPTKYVSQPIFDGRVKVLLGPAADESDSAALDMLRKLLNPDQWDVERTAVETLTSELVTRVALERPAILCIAALPPRGLAHARYLCKRLRDSSPQLQIVVGRWGKKRNVRIEREQLEDTGASFVTTTLVETPLFLKST